MKPFVFELETLLDIRHRREEQANLVLSHARKKLADAQLILTDLLTQQRDAWIEFREKQTAGEVLVADFQIWSKYLEFLKKAIAKQEEVVAKCKEEVAVALKQVEQAMKDRKSVEKLKEKRLEQYKFELQQEEQKILDEIAITRFQRQEGNEL